MKYLPLFHNLRGSRVLVVGGGEIALRKSRLLADAGALLRVVAPQIEDQLRELVLGSGGELILRGYQEADLDGCTLIIAATDEEARRKEEAIVADFGLVRAWKGDRHGNLVFRQSARNFNPPAATCGRVCVAEVEEIVPLGSLDPDTIHLPGIYVHRIVQGQHEKRIEQRTVRKREDV